MTAKEIQNLIRRHGRYKEKQGRKDVFSVCCTVCGREIKSTDAGTDEVVTITKRGTAVFCCPGCWLKVWTSKIK